VHVVDEPVAITEQVTDVPDLDAVTTISFPELVPRMDMVGVASVVTESPTTPVSLDASRAIEVGGTSGAGKVYRMITVPLAPAIPEVLSAVL
jgi:hypothetical protein